MSHVINDSFSEVVQNNWGPAFEEEDQVECESIIKELNRRGWNTDFLEEELVYAPWFCSICHGTKRVEQGEHDSLREVDCACAV